MNSHNPIEVIKCLLKLTEAEAKVYITLLENGELTVKEIANIVSYSRPTVQKTLKKLLERGLVARNRFLRRGGGHGYIYRAVPADTLDNDCLKNILKR